MRISEVIWLDTVVDKLARKHAVRADEVEEVLRNQPKFASQRREIAQARTFHGARTNRRGPLPDCLVYLQAQQRRSHLKWQRHGGMGKKAI